jgi:uncharacterized protein
MDSHHDALDHHHPRSYLLRHEVTDMDFMDRAVLASRLNNSNLAGEVSSLRNALLQGALRILGGELKDPIDEKTRVIRETQHILNSVGPAAASAAVEYATIVCCNSGGHQETFRKLHMNGSYIANHNLIINDAPFQGYQGWSNVLRQFLLPRYAYLDFDIMVDPRHRVDEECGYPKFITPIMYRYMYDRDDVARRVVDIYADETWVLDPEVYENDDEDVTTPFEQDWRDLCDANSVLQYLYRIDKLAGVGHYGALLLGVDDGEDLEKPIDEPALLAGHRRSVGLKKRNLLYMRPFDEYLSFIHQYETDVLHPRYGLPKFYNLVFLDMTIDAAGASIGTRLNRRVHWSRVVHVADNLATSLVFGTPRQQPVFNRLLDLRKIKGSSAEMMWQGGFGGISFEVDPQYVADEPEMDREALKEQIDQYSSGLNRYLMLLGVKAHSLAPKVADPTKHVAVQIEAIATHFGVPHRVFLGSEESRMASSQDITTWNKRLKRKLKTYTEPSILRNLVDRLIAIGVMTPPATGQYRTHWPDLNTPTDEDKANLSLKWSQAISQYVSTGMIHLIQPMDYFTMICGFSPADSKRIIASPGFDLEKLKKVDPSQGAGINGVRTAPANKDDSGTAASRPKKRSTAQKKIEGKTS